MRNHQVTTVNIARGNLILIFVVIRSKTPRYGIAINMSYQLLLQFIVQSFRISSSVRMRVVNDMHHVDHVICLFIFLLAFRPLNTEAEDRCLSLLLIFAYMLLKASLLIEDTFLTLNHV